MMTLIEIPQIVIARVRVATAAGCPSCGLPRRASEEAKSQHQA